ncbi:MULTISPECIES: J domain-containing protein [Ramlibacter]|uniref:J domain-containing protein n=1 Tax=Ramlibacter aquaticus TaxID=2780094 RepID=A0ABR9SCD1_9BURK|nr:MULTISPECIES: J domain-containing protein [Ramlibacter]MBE7939961.1 J domain-containing protein [Ramlibacter aquaticus]
MTTGATITHYELLRVSRRERPEGVRAAYRRLAQQFHPDKQRGNADAERVMAAINQAYAVLSDPAQRADYDRALDSGFSHSRPASLDEVRAHDRAWPWWLLFGTIAFSAAAIGTVVYKSYMPGVRAAGQVLTSATPAR